MLTPGTYLAKRYEIIEKIGSGGMADVYKAKDDKLGRFVAVKILKADFASDEIFVRKFKAEARSAAGLTNPNIVSVYDVGDEGGINYIVMELVEGITLKKYIALKGKLGTKEALNLAIQIAMGMGAAHENKITHRDIKPQNVIISKDGKAKITDFGIAKRADSGTVDTSNAGSVHYISPEQARGGFSDARSDIYSLGITMYEMVTGKVPFTGDTNVAVALAHIHNKMDPPKALVPDLPESFNRIIVKCTEKKPDYRYQSAKDLIADLRKVLTNPDGKYVVMGAQAVESGATVVMSEDDINELSRKKEGRASSTETARDDMVHTYIDPEDDDDDTDTDTDTGIGSHRKLERTMAILAIIGSVVLLAVIGVIIANAMGIIGGGDRETLASEESMIEIEVPRLEGMTLNEARKWADENDIILDVTYETSADVEKDHIISQDIKEGEKLEPDSTIKIVVSEGEETQPTKEVPDVSGRTEEAARTMLEEAGFKVDVVEKSSEEYDKGTVMRTNPRAGTECREGDTVTLYVSTGAEQITLTYQVGQSATALSASLTSLGFNVVTTQDNSDEVPEGGVITVYVNGEVAESGTKFDKGTSATIVISAGPKETEPPTETETEDPTAPIPNVINYDVATAEETLSDFGFGTKLEYSWNEGFSEGVVIMTKPAVGTRVPRNSVITLVINKKPEETAAP